MRIAFIKLGMFTYLKTFFPVLSIDIRLLAFTKTSKNRKMVYVTAGADYSNETYH